MPLKELKDRNKDIVQLFKIGWKKYALSKLFGVDKTNIRRIIVRDFTKYPNPSLEELNILKERYHIEVGVIQNVESPLNKIIK